MQTLPTSLAIEYLFRSKTRTKILWQLFRNLEYGYGIRELAREISMQINSVNRELKLLYKIGIVQLQKTSIKHRYFVNKNHPFFTSLLTILYQSHGMGAIILNNLDFFKNTNFIFLTSYYIFNLKKEKYDVDLLIVGKPDLEQVAIFLHNLESKLQHEILYSVITIQDYKIRRDAKDTFLWNIISKPFVLLKGNSWQVFEDNTIFKV